MSPSQLIGASPRRALTICCVLAVCCAAAFPALASATSVSSNWAGYVALPSTAGKSFKNVSGTWTQPSVTCTAGQESFSAAWVGLGGYHENSNALEQIGSEADCSRTGQPNYTTWYELIPAGPVTLKMHTAPGDVMSASVSVKAHAVTLRLRNLTTGAHFSLTRKVSAVDTSSAEWIVEAPSTCFNERACRTLPLSDFGSVAFSSATAKLGSYTAPIDSAAWSTVELELREGGAAFTPGGRLDARAQTSASLVAATPSALASPLSAFTVSWSEQQVQAQESSPRPFPGYVGQGTPSA